MAAFCIHWYTVFSTLFKEICKSILAVIPCFFFPGFFIRQSSFSSPWRLCRWRKLSVLFTPLDNESPFLRRDASRLKTRIEFALCLQWHCLLPVALLQIRLVTVDSFILWSWLYFGPRLKGSIRYCRLNLCVFPILRLCNRTNKCFQYRWHFILLCPFIGY